MTAGPEPRNPGSASGDAVRRRCRRFTGGRPLDYLLGLSVASASLPVVGKHLEPLGGATALGVWGARNLQEFLAKTVKTWVAPGAAATRKRELKQTETAAEDALRDVVPADALDIEWPPPEWIPPVSKAVRHRRHLHRSSVQYGSDPAQLLDVWRRKGPSAGPAPVLLFVPGGAWVQGSRTLQGYALLSHLAEQGWVCLSMDYRVAPHHRWPRHIADVKTAIAWAHANVDKYGGDRNFIAVAGCSAGGHLASLAGLTSNAPDFSAELSDGSDTAVDAVVSLYGRYDWQDRSTAERARFMEFLEKVVVGKRADRHPDVYRKASPIALVHPKAPPFLVVHGSRDSVIPVAQARDFAERLQSVAQSEVSYLELPGAGHGFDLTDGARTGAAATAVGLFLNQIHRNRTMIGAKRVI